MSSPIQRPAVMAGVLAVLATTFAPASPAAAQTPIELEGIVVTATPTPLEISRLGNHVTLIDGAGIVARGISDVADVLREVPGLSVVRSGSFGGVTSVFFRGGESDYVQVLVDGVQVNQPGGAFDLSGLTTGNIERIEIVRGPSSALHGSDAVSGVIHIITRGGAGGGPLSAGATFRAGSFGRLDTGVEVSGGNERASFGMGLARHRTDGILDFNNQYANTVLTGQARVVLDERTTASVAARIGDRAFHFPTDFSGAIVDRNQFTFSDESSVAVKLDRRISSRLMVQAKANTYAADSGTDDRPDSPADTLGFFAFESLDSYRRNALDVQATLQLVPQASLTLGGELEQQRVRSFSASRSAFGDSNGRSTNARDNQAVYGHLTANAGPVDGNAGIRFEDNEFFGGFTTWQVGASLAATGSTRFRGVVGRAIKEPTFFESFAAGFARGNPDLQPEIATSWELGVEQSLLDGALVLQATGFRQSFQNLIQYTSAPPGPGDPNYYNVARADSRGLELSGQASLGKVLIFGDITLLDTEVVDSGFDSGPGASFVEGQPLLRRPARSGRIGIGAPLGQRLRVDGVLRHVGQRDDRDFNAFPAEPVTLEAYQMVDLSLSASVLRPGEGRPGIDLTLRAENLTDQEYVEVFGFRTPGRGIYLGGRIGWGR
jgi:vitamin B12 transporter